MVGDVVLWVSNDLVQGAIEHSGIVVEVAQFNIKALSKWGALHEVVHYVTECPYDCSNLQFYRMNQ